MLNIAEGIKPVVGFWEMPAIPETISRGGLPGDKVQIDDSHIKRVEEIFQVQPLC